MAEPEINNVEVELDEHGGVVTAREVNGMKVKETKTSKKPYIMSPKEDDIVKLFWTQGYGPDKIAFNLGYPEPVCKAIVALAIEDYQRQGRPLPDRLGKPRANDTAIT